MKKRIIISLSLLFSCFALSSCGSNLTELFKSNARTAIASRAQANKDIVNGLATAGVLSTEQRDIISKQIESEAQKIIDSTDDTNGFITLISTAVTQYKLASTNIPASLHAIDDKDKQIDLAWFNDEPDTFYGEDRKGMWCNVDEEGNPIEPKISPRDMRKADSGDGSNPSLSAFVIGNYLHCNTYRSFFKDLKEKDESIMGKSYRRDNIEHYNQVHDIPYEGTPDINVEPTPLKFISEEMAEKINKDISKIQVYVLKPTIANSVDNDIDTLLDMIDQKVKNSTDKSGTETKSFLQEYFIPAVDVKTKQNLYLIDENNKKWNLIGESKAWNPESRTNNVEQPGYDLVIDQEELKDAVHLRCYEFSNDAYTLFKNLLTDCKDGTYISRYYISKNDDKSGINAYLMEYPLEYISEMNNSEDGDYVECGTKMSGLGINLMEQVFVKYKYSPSSETGWDTSETEMINKDFNNGYYLSLNPNKDANSKLSNTSVCLNGTTVNQIFAIGSGTEVSTDPLQEEHIITTGRLILRDYLEATFAPDFQQDSTKSAYGENLVAFGRKIRFDMDKDKWKEEKDTFKVEGEEPIPGYHNTFLRYKKSDTKAAYFVNQDGTEVKTSPSLAITEFCDIKQLEKDDYQNCKLVTLAQDGEKSHFNHKEVSGTPEISDLSTVVIDGKNKIDEYTDIYIEPSEVFPSIHIAASDFESDVHDIDSSKQRFYVMATRSGLLKTSLYSSWINSQSESGSLDWWNGYLSANNFDYTIDNNAVNNYVNRNYKFAVTDSNIVILDLDTVKKIEEQFKEEDTIEKNSIIKTIFVVGGWLMIVYSAILMLLWAIDVNSGLGLPLLQKATFGHWVAIKYEDDIPNGREKGPNGESYMTLKRMLIRVGAILLLSLILIYVNMNWVVLTLIKSFGRLGSSIEKIISGAGI